MYLNQFGIINAIAKTFELACSELLWPQQVDHQTCLDIFVSTWSR